MSSPTLDSPQGLHNHESPLKQKKIRTISTYEGQFTLNGCYEVGQKTMVANIEDHDVAMKSIVEPPSPKFDLLVKKKGIM